MQRAELIEKLAEKVHKAYCKYYEVRHGKPYWTNGDYNLLDEDTKEADRVTVRAVLDSLVVDEDRARYLVKGALPNHSMVVTEPKYMKPHIDSIVDAIANDGEVWQVKE